MSASPPRRGPWLLAAVLGLVLLAWWVTRPREVLLWPEPVIPPPPERAERPKPRPRLPAPERLAEPVLDPEAFEAMLEALRAQVRSEPPEELPDAAVLCPLGGAVAPVRGVAWLRGRSAYSGFAVVASGDMLYLDTDLEAAEVMVRLEGYEVAPLTFLRGEDGEFDCSPLELHALSVAVTGVVRNAEGEPEGRVWVRGCGGYALTDADGAYFLEARAGACVLRAYRQDGVFTVPGPAEALELHDGDEAVVDLSVPDWPGGGMGMAVAEDPRGIRVMGVVEGGDAGEQGLQHGDLVLEIDGEPTEGMSLEDFVERGLGREGTEVELVVEADGEERRMVLTRRAIEER